MPTDNYPWCLWDAFCTIHWFITGEQIVSLSTHPMTDELYMWYLKTEKVMEE